MSKEANAPKNTPATGNQVRPEDRRVWNVVIVAASISE